MYGVPSRTSIGAPSKPQLQLLTAASIPDRDRVSRPLAKYLHRRTRSQTPGASFTAQISLPLCLTSIRARSRHPIAAPHSPPRLQLPQSQGPVLPFRLQPAITAPTFTHFGGAYHLEPVRYLRRFLRPISDARFPCAHPATRRRPAPLGFWFTRSFGGVPRTQNGTTNITLPPRANPKQAMAATTIVGPSRT